MESLTTRAIKLPKIINLDGRDNETALVRTLSKMLMEMPARTSF